MRRWIGSAVIILVAVLLLPQVGNIRPGFDPLGPAFLPAAILWSIIGLAVLDILVQVRRPNAETGSSGDVPGNLNLRSLVTIVLLILYIGCMASRLVTFEIATIVFLTTLIAFLRRPSWPQLGLIVVGTSALSFTLGYVFRSVLFVFLP